MSDDIDPKLFEEAQRAQADVVWPTEHRPSGPDTSRGALKEMLAAQRLGVPVYFAFDRLPFPSVARTEVLEVLERVLVLTPVDSVWDRLESLAKPEAIRVLQIAISKAAA